MARPLNKAEAHGKRMTYLSKSLAIGLTTPIIAVVHLDSTMRNEGGEATSLKSGGRLFSLFPHRGLKVFIESCRMMELSLSLGKRMLIAYMLYRRIYGSRTSLWGEEAIVIGDLAKHWLTCGWRATSMR